MRYSTFAWLTLALAACTGCGDSSKNPAAKAPKPASAQGPKEMEEVEPNDTLATAMSIREPVRISANLRADGPKPDEDLYRLEALGVKKVAAFEVTGIPGADIALELLDRDGNHAGVVNSEGEGKGERIANLNLASPWIIKVYSVKKGSGGAYIATVTYGDAAPDFEIEPNNRAVDATPLPLGKAMKGLLADRGDEDWYKIEVPIPEMPAGAATGAPIPAPGSPAAPPRAGEPGLAGVSLDAGATPAQPSAAEPAASAVGPGSLAAASPDSGAALLLPTAVVRLEVSGVPDVRLQVEVANQAQAV
ncbi:MAG TPA: hypothetical protein VMK12_29715, partial [Anaeromyxobacteraceae bacterium]|nr:hypothetical protein [Anaeromyxobacteraceae bacterium]